jgi:methyl-accepting chemotaxis protein
MLMMRRHEKDLMLRDDLRYAAEMANRAKEFAELLEASSIQGTPLEEIRAGMAAYQRDFAAYAEAKSGSRLRRERSRTLMQRSTRLSMR